MTKLQDHVNQKLKMEQDMMSQFLAVLNAKKDKISELQQQLIKLQCSKPPEKKKRSRKRNKDDNAVDYSEDTDEDVEMVPEEVNDESTYSTRTRKQNKPSEAKTTTRKRNNNNNRSESSLDIEMIPEKVVNEPSTSYSARRNEYSKDLTSEDEENPFRIPPSSLRDTISDKVCNKNLSTSSETTSNLSIVSEPMSSGKETGESVLGKEQQVPFLKSNVPQEPIVVETSCSSPSFLEPCVAPDVRICDRSSSPSFLQCYDSVLPIIEDQQAQVGCNSPSFLQPDPHQEEIRHGTTDNAKNATSLSQSLCMPNTDNSLIAKETLDEVCTKSKEKAKGVLNFFFGGDESPEL